MWTNRRKCSARIFTNSEVKTKKRSSYQTICEFPQILVSIPKNDLRPEIPKISTNSEVKTNTKKGLRKFFQILLFIPKNVRISTSSEVKTKKGLPPKICPSFHKSWGEATKAIGVYCKIYEKTVLAHEFQGDNQYFFLELHSNSTKPVNFWGTSLAWGAQLLFGGAQFLFGGAQAVIWGGHGPGMLSSGAGPEVLMPC